MSKRTIYAALLLCTTLAIVSCSGEATDGDSAAGTGVLEMNISTTRAEADGEYDPKDHLVARIYNSRSELIRKYTSETFVKQLELIAGEYRIAVEAGEIVPASFSKRFYKGEKTFTVTPGQTTVAEVKCSRQNTAAEVKFDASVPQGFGTNYHFWIVADDAFDEEKAGQEIVPALKYTSDATGYFTLPEGVTTFTWHFEGTHSERGQIVMEGKQENIQAGGKYVFTCLFSKDLPGFIQCVVIKVDTSSDEQDDTIVFSPDPTVEGDGFEIDQPQGYIPGDTWTRTYKLAAMAPLQAAELRFGEQTYDLMSGTPAEGISVVRNNDLGLTVTLSEAFLAGCPAGSYSASFHVTDTKDAETTVASELRVQGILPVGKEDYDLWNNSVTLRAMVVDPDVTAVTFELKNGEEWQELAGTADANGYYTATCKPDWTESTNDAGLTVYSPAAGTGIAAGTNYELRCEIGGQTYPAALATPAGDTIYNAGMDYWTTYKVTGSSITGGTVPYPNENSSTVFWVGGNNAQTNALCTGVNVNDNDDSDKCAQLKPDVKVNIFAAGNLFTGTFDCGTGLLDTFGFARFGVQYTFSARPRALRLRYKATITNVTNTGKSDLTTNDIDSARVFVCVVDWTGRHAVKSGAAYDESTFWDPETKSSLNEGPILGYSSKKLGESTDGWDTMELPILWYDKDKAPAAGNYSLVISCATSYKGDYVAGSTSNLLCVENFEWVY